MHLAFELIQNSARGDGLGGSFGAILDGAASAEEAGCFQRCRRRRNSSASMDDSQCLTEADLHQAAEKNAKDLTQSL